MRKVILSSFPGESVTGRWGGREESAYLVRTSVRKRSQVSKMSAPCPKQCQHCSVIYAPEVPMVQVKAKARLYHILPGPRTFPPFLAGFFSELSFNALCIWIPVSGSIFGGLTPRCLLCARCLTAMPQGGNATHTAPLAGEGAFRLLCTLSTVGDLVGQSLTCLGPHPTSE